MIDNLGSGGAQRQLVMIGCGLKARGHEVEFFTYYPSSWEFKTQLDCAGIPVHVYAKKSRFSLGPLVGLHRTVRGGRFDAVIAFLETPALYAELVGQMGRDWGLVVGERSANPAMRAGWKRWIRWPHRFADAVVTNSHSNRLLLERSWPRLAPKLTTIYNAVDLDRFRPASTGLSTSNGLTMVVVASYQRLKNMLGLAKALLLLRDSGGHNLVIDWFGATPSNAEPLAEARAFVEEHELQEMLRFHPPKEAIETEYQRCDVVGLFSEYEGLPNVICEAMACGKPVIAGNVSDVRLLVEDGRTGILCDPGDPESVARALREFTSLTPDRRSAMGGRARERAQEIFAPYKMLDEYERILSLVRKRKHDAH
ncbi:MAG: glycosyltransferase family 4 protein [Burkholderiales bacterium]|nr:glycosyltransferase family 4 protein [Burkholderiales bacterium]